MYMFNVKSKLIFFLYFKTFKINYYHVYNLQRSVFYPYTSSHSCFAGHPRWRPVVQHGEENQEQFRTFRTNYSLLHHSYIIAEVTELRINHGNKSILKGPCFEEISDTTYNW